MRSRRILASALIAGLALIASSPFWHAGHQRPLLQSLAQENDHSTGRSLRSGHTSAAHPADSCLICLSQRLLGQSWIQAEAGLATPSFTPHRLFVSAALPTAGTALSPDARAPPLC